MHCFLQGAQYNIVLDHAQPHPPLTRSESALELLQRRRMRLNMSASSSSGGITRIVSSQGAGCAALSLVQSSIRSSCTRNPGQS